MFQRFQRWVTGSAAPAVSAVASGSPRLSVESLEPREVMAGEPLGSEFQVNFYTTGAQQTFNETPGAVASDAAGNFVVVWSSQLEDGSGYGVFGQRFNAQGVAQGSEFRVNTFTTGDQKWASVAMDSDGDFVVTWTSYGQEGPNGGYGVFAQRFNAQGVAQGGEFQVNTVTQSNQRWSTVAMDSDGDFVVTWTSDAQDGSGQGIYAAAFTANGTLRNGEFRVNTYTTQNQIRSAVAMDADGDFAVTWMSYNQDGARYGIYAQRFDRNLVPRGDEFRVNTTTTGIQLAPSIAMDSDGDFVVAWSGYSTDRNGYNVYAQRFNAAGVAQGIELQVNTYFTASQNIARVAMDSDGDFVVTWTSYGQDNFLAGIFGQRFDRQGVAQGIEFQVNTTTTFSQTASSVAMDSDGDFVVVWSSVGQDGDNYGIFAQRFRGPGATSGPSNPIGSAVVAADPVDAARQSLFVNGTEGNDLIKVGRTSSGYVVKINGYTYSTPFAFDGRVYINGLGGNDTIQYGTTGLAEAVIDGGDGNDKLYGGRVADVLLGGAGNDYLNGGGGRDLLIGGAGRDKLYGSGSGSTRANEGNILIGDSTVSDGDATALTSILAAWQINDQATVRTFLDETKVVADGQADYLRSATQGIDWAFSFELDSRGRRLDRLVLGRTDLIN